MTKEDQLLNRSEIIRMAREADREWDCDRDMVEWLEWFAALVEAKASAAAKAEEREVILTMLKGIDCTETEDPDGWWETSAGADFGAGILEAIRARGETTSRGQA